MTMKKKATIAAAIALVFLVGLVSGAILFSKNHSFTSKVKKGYGLQLWNQAKTSEVTAITWSDFDLGRDTLSEHGNRAVKSTLRSILGG